MTQQGATQLVPGSGGATAAAGGGLDCGTTTVSLGGGFGLLLLNERQPEKANGSRKAKTLNRSMRLSLTG